MALAGAIKAERVQQKLTNPDLTQAEVARRAKIPHDTYKSIETGRAAIDADQLFAIARALGVSASKLAEQAEARMAEPTATVTKLSDRRETLQRSDDVDLPKVADDDGTTIEDEQEGHNEP